MFGLLKSFSSRSSHFLLASILFSSTASFAAEGLWNRFDCGFTKENGKWVRDFGFHSGNSFSIPKGQIVYSPSIHLNEANPAGLVFGLCTGMAEGSTPDSVTITSTSWSAQSIEWILDCEIRGVNTKEVGNQSVELKRGETAEFYSAWSKQGVDTELMFVTHIPTEEEMKDPDNSYYNFCESIAP